MLLVQLRQFRDCGRYDASGRIISVAGSFKIIGKDIGVADWETEEAGHPVISRGSSGSSPGRPCRAPATGPAARNHLPRCIIL